MSRYAYWTSGLLFAALVLAKFNPQTGFTSLLRFGDTWQLRRHSALENLPIATVTGSNGYDGQFYATLALDPLLRGDELRITLDAPAYRARRILVPAAANLLGLGSPWWVLQAYALANIPCWFGLAWLLHRRIAGHDSIAFARWAGCMFSMGVLESVRQSLVDLPALLLIALAVEAHDQLRSRGSALWLALGNLTKETTALGAVALYADGLWSGNWRRHLATLGLSALPLIGWSCYVQHRLGDPASGLGLGNFSWPLLGILAQFRNSLREILAGNLDGRYFFSLIAMVGLGVQAVILWQNRNYRAPWWRIGAAYSLLLIFLSIWVWSGYWATCRAVLPMTVAFNLLLPANRRFWLLWTVGNLTMLHAVWRFL
jgi:hypothetical protein